jgi:pyruvate dehydrogenase E1 component alpha subunit
VQAAQADARSDRLSTGIELHRIMVTIRVFEERVAALFSAGRLPGFVHLYVGQEAVAAGICLPLTETDAIVSTHRAHGHVIAKGCDLRKIMAELFGKQTGYCKGKGGSMHLADPAIGVIGANGIVGAGLPLGVGYALASQTLGRVAVAVCFFGDGAANHGTFHEALNLAAIWHLPVVFVCENNGYTELTPMETLTAGDIYRRAEPFGIPGYEVDGSDAFEVLEASTAAIERARAGDGPTLIEARTFRYRDHAEGLAAIVGVTRHGEDLAKHLGSDPIPKHREQLLELGAAGDDLVAIESEARLAVDDAVEFAESSPDPQPNEAYEDVFAQLDDRASNAG